MSKFVRVVLSACAFFLLAAAAAVWYVACSTNLDQSLEILAPSGALADNYVGSQRCGTCHREIFDRQSSSHMATALTTADDPALLDSLAVPVHFVDSAHDVSYTVDWCDGRLSVAVYRGDEGVNVPVDYALGSGKRGLTFLNELDADTYEELRISYFADTKSWDLTPGQEQSQPRTLAEALGRPVAKRSELACLNCHATLLTQARGEIDLRHSQLGVGCERCHGPGRDHVEAAERGSVFPTLPPALDQARELAKMFGSGHPAYSPQDEFLASVAAVGDDRLLRDLYVCGDCHGRSDIWRNLSEQMLPRSQFAALTASACYRLSETKLRCTDCHDPHGDIDRDGDFAEYVAVCLKCHEPMTTDVTAVAAERRWGQKSCPVDARGRCIGCHMPTRTPMNHVNFTHHRIGIYSESYQAPNSAD